MNVGATQNFIEDYDQMIRDFLLKLDGGSGSIITAAVVFDVNGGSSLPSFELGFICEHGNARMKTTTQTGDGDHGDDNERTNPDCDKGSSRRVDGLSSWPAIYMRTTYRTVQTRNKSRFTNGTMNKKARPQSHAGSVSSGNISHKKTSGTRKRCTSASFSRGNLSSSDGGLDPSIQQSPPSTGSMDGFLSSFFDRDSIRTSPKPTRPVSCSGNIPHGGVGDGSAASTRENTLNNNSKSYSAGAGSIGSSLFLAKSSRVD
eukprot:CAMPEP_0195509992 /NCGR_PEP_ID=MMETSP0794_2-20130614/2771_1 /TAXON_ID=515487 /ORGANISM="Stephanopyxis turris, Strain CCMP 815" /LENGTH=258 /DNA_ID=CAMNT_0040637335 /DNA_START=450 /DNA_END=1223 /DNA_ORIENTATION=+